MSSPRRPARELVPEGARAAVMRGAQKTLHRLGYELVAIDPTSPEAVRRAKLLATTGADVVLDVGASTGEYAKALRRTGYGGRIICFEPRATGFAKLSEAAASDPTWEAHHLALGSEDGTAEINVAGNDDSSSLLEMEDRHLQSAPYSKYVGRETIQTARLDAIWDELISDGERVFLKLDVQGFELEALRGAEGSLPGVVGVELELSLVPLYTGAPDFRSLIDHLEQRGFRLAGLEPGHEDRKTGEMLQADGLFIRIDAAA